MVGEWVFSRVTSAVGGLVVVVGAKGRAKLSGSHVPSGSGGDGSYRGAGDDGVATGLHLHQVCSGISDDLTAPGDVRHVRDEVAHGAACHVEGSGLAGQLGRALLQGDDGGVVTEDIIADLGCGHGHAHGRAGLGDGVGTEVDEVGHGPASISPLHARRVRLVSATFPFRGDP